MLRKRISCLPCSHLLKMLFLLLLVSSITDDFLLWVFYCLLKVNRKYLFPICPISLISLIGPIGPIGLIGPIFACYSLARQVKNG